MEERDVVPIAVHPERVHMVKNRPQARRDLFGREVVVDPRTEALADVVRTIHQDDRDKSSSASASPTAASRARRTTSMSMFAQWLSIERNTSRGSLPTQRYVTRSSRGRPSKGVCVLMKRRCCCASRAANRVSSLRVCWSSHGEIWLRGSVEVRILEDQERAQHLRPRRAALRRRADDDVAVTKLEAVPASAVEHERAVVHAIRHVASDCAFARAHYRSRRIARLEIAHPLEAESSLTNSRCHPEVCDIEHEAHVVAELDAIAHGRPRTSRTPRAPERRPDRESTHSSGTCPLPGRSRSPRRTGRRVGGPGRTTRGRRGSRRATRRRRCGWRSTGRRGTAPARCCTASQKPTRQPPCSPSADAVTMCIGESTWAAS